VSRQCWCRGSVESSHWDCPCSSHGDVNLVVSPSSSGRSRSQRFLPSPFLSDLFIFLIFASSRFRISFGSFVLFALASIPEEFNVGGKVGNGNIRTYHITRNLCYVRSEFCRFPCRWSCLQGRAEQYITFFSYAV
jgi:hypothetical protein